MITLKEMEKAEGRYVKIIFYDGEIWERRFCDCFHWSEGDEENEENMLEFGNILVNQSEIKSIEILD